MEHSSFPSSFPPSLPLSLPPSPTHFSLSPFLYSTHYFYMIIAFKPISALQFSTSNPMAITRFIFLKFNLPHIIGYIKYYFFLHEICFYLHGKVKLTLTFNDLHTLSSLALQVTLLLLPNTDAQFQPG